MIRTQSLVVYDRDIQKALGLKAHYNYHESNSGFGVDRILGASVRQYEDKECNIIPTQQAIEMLVAFLKEKEIIAPDSIVLSGANNIKAHHSWGDYDDDGYASPIYSHYIEIVLKNESINF